MMPTLYIIRGLPGSGKSTLARKLVTPADHFEADMYHINEGGAYAFDASKVKDAHQWCRDSVETATGRRRDVAVSNTFTRRWEYQPYIDIAESAGYDWQVIDCHGRWGTIHDVPEPVLIAMADRWEPHADNVAAHGKERIVDPSVCK
jgi:predicted kinase